MPTPIRTCVVCRRRRPQAELVRIGRGADGRPRVGRSVPGRGAYVCPEAACLGGLFEKGRLARALRTALPPEVKLAIEEELSCLAK